MSEARRLADKLRERAEAARRWHRNDRGREIYIPLEDVESVVAILDALAEATDHVERLP